MELFDETITLDQFDSLLILADALAIANVSQPSSLFGQTSYMYVCMYVCIYPCMYGDAKTHIQMCMYVCTYVSMYG